MSIAMFGGRFCNNAFWGYLNVALQYRNYRGRKIPVYDAPRGLAVLDKIRGKTDWSAWINVAPCVVTDMLFERRPRRPSAFDELIVTENLKSGIYIVTLNNDQPISVNANDPRIAEKAIKVTKKNCKIGKAKDLAGRKKNYFKVFGEHNVNFRPVVKMVEIDTAEKAILARLDQYRIRGMTGRKNEWLQNIEPSELLRIALCTLFELGLPFERVEW